MDWNLFRADGLAKALTGAGHDVSKRTVERWKSGAATPSKAQLEAIRGLIGGAQQETPPEWAGLMEARIVSEVRANREALYARLADEAVTRALRLAGLLPPEPSDETPDQQPGSAGPSREPRA